MNPEETKGNMKGRGKGKEEARGAGGKRDGEQGGPIEEWEEEKLI